MVKPFDTIKTLVQQLKEVFVQRGDPIIQWDLEKSLFRINGPLFGNNNPENSAIEERKEGESISLTQSMVIIDYDHPFQAFKMAQGTTVMIEGPQDALTFNSEKPLQCVTLSFKKEDNKPIDYFSCKSCNKNWICEQCKDGCHKGHELLPHVMNHQAASAICYCVKYKLCKIPNIKNKKG